MLKSILIISWFDCSYTGHRNIDAMDEAAQLAISHKLKNIILSQFLW